MDTKVRCRRSVDKVHGPAAPGSAPEVDGAGGESELPAMQYHVMTEVSPEEVVERAKRFFAERAHLGVREPEAGMIIFAGDIGAAEFRIDRAHGHTNVRVRTDRVAGLDITDLTKRFLYTLGHV